MQSGCVHQETFSKDIVTSDGFKQGNGILHRGAARGITEPRPYLRAVRASLLTINKSEPGISRKRINWNNFVIAGYPLAAKFNEIYSRLVQCEDKEATRKLNESLPSHYDNIIVLDSHAQHLDTVPPPEIQTKSLLFS